MWAKHIADNDVGLCEVFGVEKEEKYSITVQCGRILGNCISMNRNFSYYFVEVLPNLSSISMSIIEVFNVPELLSLAAYCIIISYIWF